MGQPAWLNARHVLDSFKMLTLHKVPHCLCKEFNRRSKFSNRCSCGHGRNEHREVKTKELKGQEKPTTMQRSNAPFATKSNDNITPSNNSSPTQRVWATTSLNKIAAEGQLKPVKDRWKEIPNREEKKLKTLSKSKNRVQSSQKRKALYEDKSELNLKETEEIPKVETKEKTGESIEVYRVVQAAQEYSDQEGEIPSEETDDGLSSIDEEEKISEQVFPASTELEMIQRAYSLPGYGSNNEKVSSDPRPTREMLLAMNYKIEAADAYKTVPSEVGYSSFEVDKNTGEGTESSGYALVPQQMSEDESDESISSVSSESEEDEGTVANAISDVKKAKKRKGKGGKAQDLNSRLTASTVSAITVSKDWNLEFQEIFERLENYRIHYTLDEEVPTQAFKDLINLAHDFEYASKSYGRIIISEVALPEEKKTVKPVKLGGQAGGLKYIVQGILFKFALDWKGLYGSDESAMKAAAHEVRGVMGVYQSRVPGLHTPLITLIDYRGFRLIAASIIPILKTSIIYGSNDAAHTVHKAVPEFNEKMKMLAKYLNLKGHRVGFCSRQRKLYGPVDLEGHLGLDSRYYLLDFARMFPPEYIPPPQRVHGCNLFRQLRPELVRRNAVPLSSDSMSNFGVTDYETHDKELREATNKLYNEIIPEFAAWLTTLKDQRVEDEAFLLDNRMHQNGINNRFLGRIRAHISEKFPNVRAGILVHMIARAMKNQLRRGMRQLAKQHSVSGAPTSVGNGAYSDHVLDFFNVAFARMETYQERQGRLWKENLKKWIEKYFPGGLTNSELQAECDLRSAVQLPGLEGLRVIFSTLALLLRIKFHKSARLALAIGASYEFEFVQTDLKLMEPRVKRSNIIAHIEAMLIQKRALERVKNPLSEEAKSHRTSSTPDLEHIDGTHSSSLVAKIDSDRLFRIARSKYEESLKATPDSEELLVAYGDALCQQAMSHWNDKSLQFKLLRFAFQRYQRAHSAEKLCELGALIGRCADKTERKTEKEALFQLACTCYRAVVRMKPPSSTPRLNSSFGKPETTDKPLSSLSSTPKTFSFDQRRARAYHEWGKLFQKQISFSYAVQYQIKAGSKYRRAMKLAPELFVPLVFLDSQSHCWLMDQSEYDIATVVEVYLNDPMLRQISADALAVQPSGSALIALVKNLPAPSAVLHIDLSHCREITNEELEVIASHVPQLKALSLKSCDGVSDSVVSSFAAHCTSLVSIKLRGCRHLTQDCVLEIARHCKQLTHICLRGLCNVAPAALVELWASCTQLQRVHMENCNQVADMVVVSLAKSVKNNLRVLNIGRCVRLTNASMLALGEHCPQLRKLLIPRCHYITDQGLAPLTKRCERLVHVNISHIPTLTKDGILGLATNKLAKLHMKGGWQLTDDIMVQIARLSPELKSLNLLHCHQITETSILEVAKSCTLLEELFLAAPRIETTTSNIVVSNKITDRAILRLAQSCTNLQTLQLRGFKYVTDISVRCVATSCPNLRTLRLDHCNQITDAALLVVAQRCTALQRLSVNYCTRVTSAPILQIGLSCPALSAVHLNGVKNVTDEAISGAIAVAPLALQVLSVAANDKITDASICDVARNCAHLKELHISRCGKVTDAAVINISKGCKHLTAFSSAWCKISDASVVALSEYCGGTLQRLDLEMCTSLSCNSLLAVATYCTSLRMLNVASCQSAVQDRVLLRLAARCTHMQELVLSYCTEVTDVGVSAVAKNCPLLHVLHLDGCFKVTDASIIALCAKSAGNLSRVRLRGNANITDVALKSLSHSCPRINELALSGCAQLTGDALRDLALNCPSLCHLDLRGCHRVDNASLTLVAQHCTMLHTLNLSLLDHLSNETVIQFAQSCRYLEEWDLSACTKIDDSAIIPLSRCCGSVLSLNLSCCAITDAALVQLAANCQNLMRLHLCGCRGISDAGVEPILQCGTLLEINLSMSGVTSRLVQKACLKNPGLLLCY